MMQRKGTAQTVLIMHTQPMWEAQAFQCIYQNIQVAAAQPSVNIK